MLRSVPLREAAGRYAGRILQGGGSIPILQAAHKLGGVMKRLTWILAVPMLLSMLVRAQNSPPREGEAHNGSEQDRMLFPRDAFWGWAQFDLAPPHNEIDPNICAGNAGQYGGVNAPCSMFARYMLSAILEVRPFGRGPLRRFMVFGAPAFLFGKNIPQTLYTWSFDAIGIEHSWGAAVYMGKGFEFRVTQHFLFDRLGARDRNLGPADQGNNGPWGRYMTVGVRKSFGTRRW
ncbi:MAG: hypothetical protein DMG76_17970 [Acidobacteria bacterium]|nr:MAG: hypothetical protein DMG76_17970 [Acidobacteriota bacterium]